ncbi:vanadium-dependent haloperoxidase [Candidatus Gracilibacteria bacterium]|nr:vanadium-dependent haloperoxidase [Candidatus Gracilibacteria bacterium]NJM88663.1 vanadium-dependent haloperoxidase [Hydrococcus sp. RU_2_2]NJP19962.1 vanadium-dependent haloperoxidase [Hydrococcus sp. CRU_1_1]
MVDSILFWNAVALEANRVSHTDGSKEQNGPTLSSRALAIIHLAMYDAYAGVVKNSALPPYLPQLPQPAPGASAASAVTSAAHATLSSLFPSQEAFFNSKRADFDAKRAEKGDVDANNAGHEFGLVVAQKILGERKDDPNDSDAGYVPSSQRGKHRVDPDNPNQGFSAPFYGARSKGFAITKRHVLEESPFDNDEYLKALRQVRGKGIAPELMGTLPDDIEARTVDETIIGIFWAYDGASGLGTPPRLYNQIVRRVAIAKGNTEAQNARLFALVNAAMGDAGILAWEQKYIHDLWRPVLGIREHDESFGPAATATNNNISDDGDPSWLPLGAPASNSTGAKNFTPPFPAYPSGHATFGAAALHITRLFYHVSHCGSDDLFDGLDFVSEELNGKNKDNKGAVRPRHRRKFDGGLWQMIIENGLSRVYLGVHWVFDAFSTDNNGEPNLSRNVGGVPLGIAIAEDIFNSGLKRSMVGPRT